jgi:photosystem II stability/assembly factor-like uncharacterized protein
MNRFSTITGRLLCAAALSIVIIHGSCVDDTIIPEEEPIGWIEISFPRHFHNLYVLSLTSNGQGALFQGTQKYQNLWRSTDRGRYWRRNNYGLNTGCDVIALLVGSGEKVFAGLSGGGVFVSGDNGASWTQINNHMTDLDIRSMTINAAGDIIAATDNGVIFRSADDGGVWNRIEEESIETPVSTLAAGTTGILYAGCRGQGVFISENGGESWMDASDGIENLDVRCLAVHGEGYILAGTSGGEIYKSPGGVEPWVRIDRGAAGTDINAIAIDRSGAIWAGTSGDGIIRSGDGGESWERSVDGLQGLEILSLLCEEDVLLAGTAYYGVFRSIDGGRSWVSPMDYHSDNFVKRRCRSFLIDPFGSYYLMNNIDILKSYDEGGTWVRACHGLSDSYLPDIELLSLAVLPDGSLCTGTAQGIFISTDHGNRWTRADTFSIDPPRVYTVETAANGMIFGLTSSGVLRSGAGGASWEYVCEEPNPRCISVGSDSCVYIGTNHGIMRSTDSGEAWEQVTDSIRVESIDADGIGNVFAACRNGILRSCDGGDNWTTIPLESIPLEQLVIATTPGGEIAIVLNYKGHLLISYDRFTTWTMFETLFYNHIPYFGADGHLFIFSMQSVQLHRSTCPLF